MRFLWIKGKYIKSNMRNWIKKKMSVKQTLSILLLKFKERNKAIFSCKNNSDIFESRICNRLFQELL